MRFISLKSTKMYQSHPQPGTEMYHRHPSEVTEPLHYKNLLQEVLQKNGHPLPKYVTISSGPAHLRSFVGTVKINGVCYEGKASQTKKQAELFVAKVAYTALQNLGHDSSTDEDSACTWLSAEYGSAVKMHVPGMNTRMTDAKGHIDHIRRIKFSIGKNVSNPLAQDTHNALTMLFSSMFSVKGVHFLTEIIQYAIDNEYPEQVDPALEFVVKHSDICGLGASATLLVFNNDVGFFEEKIESLCTVAQQQREGYFGSKGIGFNSVFLVSAQPHILSNGYQIRFNEAPNQDCGIGYIVPEWFASKPTAIDIQNIYGSNRILPATTIILPLKREKLAEVEKQLGEILPGTKLGKVSLNCYLC